MKETNYNEIVCPYCFGKFSHEQVVFRTPSVVTKQAAARTVSADLLGDAQQAMPSKTTVDVDDYFRPFDSAAAQVKDKKIDRKLVEFWKDRGGERAYPQDWQYPHIDPADKESFYAMTRRGCEDAGVLVGEDGFIRDCDGFVRGVMDVKSDPFSLTTRLCPHCHNPLPLPSYGKEPTYFIGVLGGAGVGKTVYLNQLLTKISHTILRVGFALSKHKIADVCQKISENGAMPAPTDREIMYPPFVASLKRMDPKPGEDEYVTLVFYDVAGENCVNKEEGEVLAGNIVAHCDAFILLVDPEQVPGLAKGNSDRSGEIARLLETMVSFRAQAFDDPTLTRTPVAVTLSKIDQIRGTEQVPSDCILFGEEQKKGVYDREEGIETDRFLSELIKSDLDSAFAHLHLFCCRRFFAVSALSQEPYANVHLGDPLRWILWQFGLIGPYFTCEPLPKKSFFMSQKRYEEKLKEIERAQKYAENVFYGRLSDEA